MKKHQTQHRYLTRSRERVRATRETGIYKRKPPVCLQYKINIKYCTTVLRLNATEQVQQVLERTTRSNVMTAFYHALLSEAQPLLTFEASHYDIGEYKYSNTGMHFSLSRTESLHIHICVCSEATCGTHPTIN